MIQCYIFYLDSSSPS